MLTHGIGLVPMATPVEPSMQYAAFLGSVLLIGFIGLLGEVISAKAKWDDKVRLILWIVLVGFLLVQVPLIQMLGGLFQDLVTWIAEALESTDYVGTGANISLIITLIAGIIFAVRFYQRKSFWRLLWLIMAIITFFGTSSIVDVTQQYVVPFGVTIFNWASAAFDGIFGFDPTS